jgi:N-acetyl-1-D-myo-inositol-2-amino-2-deoxy-alpha-D-glucopyranoside deacetylase/mycothiol S-conjugate amidase
VRKRTILGVFAHPDDESMGPGATLAKYAAAGHRVAVVIATDGGAGRLYAERPADEAGRGELRRTRRRETEAAARALGIELLGFLGWEDGRLRRRDILETEEQIAAILRRERPDVVLTFHPSGISYHPDHRVMTLATMGAFLGAGDAEWYRDGPAAELPPHRPARLYAMTLDRDAGYWKDFPRPTHRSPREAITAVIDTAATADVKWRAIEAHDSQRDGPPFRRLWEAGAFREEYFVRLFPAPSPGSPPETDLLAGLD